jgi:hypothetical protein
VTNPIPSPLFAGPVKPATPELDKRSEVIDAGTNLVLANFLDWLTAQGIELCKFSEEEEIWYPQGRSNEELLAAHFGLDLSKIEAERMSLLNYLREINNS